MASRLDPLRAVPCTYPECAKSFDTKAEMRLHKREEPDHFYCKKCDVDCESWADLTQHKVDMMSPFLEGAMKGMGQHPKHIVCEFCGEDFKSFAGRKHHRDTSHQADQSIICPGCSHIFVRAAHMIDHLERNQCDSISAYDFRVSIQQKYILKEVMGDPEPIINEMNRIADTQMRQALPPLVTAGSVVTRSAYTEDTDTDSDSEDGGIGLLDTAVEEARDHTSLHAIPSSNRQTQDAWRALSKGKPIHNSCVQDMSKLSVKSSRDSSISEQKPISRSDSGYEQAANSQHVATDSTTPSRAQGPQSNVMTRPAWSKALFPQATPTPPTAQMLAALEKLDVHVEKDVSMLEYCNIRSDHFDADRFFDKVIDRYVCPFKGCEALSFAEQEHVRLHFIWDHTKRRFNCPVCLKLFKKPSSLVAHIESTQKCGVRRTDQLLKLIDEMSGGLLKAKTLKPPEIYRPSTDLVKAGQPMAGVMITEYKAIKW